MTSRSFTGLVLAALLAAPAAAQAQSAQSNRAQSNRGYGVWLGGLFGLEAGSETGGQLRFDAEIPITRLAPNFQVAGVGTVSYAFLSNDLRVFEILPSARFTWSGTRQFGAYGDVGLGIFHASGKIGSTGATLRFLGGAYYEMNPTTRFVAEIGLHPHFGDYDDTTFTLMIGAKFRI
jgi:hypothetical protein